jgi:Sec-independent protein translocase protein TatA
VAGELGRSIKDFREGLSGKEEQSQQTEKTEDKK